MARRRTRRTQVEQPATVLGSLFNVTFWIIGATLKVAFWTAFGVIGFLWIMCKVPE